MVKVHVVAEVVGIAAVTLVNKVLREEQRVVLGDAECLCHHLGRQEARVGAHLANDRVGPVNHRHGGTLKGHEHRERRRVGQRQLLGMRYGLVRRDVAVGVQRHVLERLSRNLSNLLTCFRRWKRSSVHYLIRDPRERGINTVID